MPSALAVTGVTKRLSGSMVVDGVSLEVPEGSVFGFLGPNGAGKTTTIRMLLGLVRPDSGSVELLGARGSKIRSVLPRVGALIEGPGYVPYLSARDNLSRLLAAEGVRRRDRAAAVEAAIERVGLGSAAGKAVGRYSLGMRQRLGLAGALLRDRDLYILDEPTNGLDPSGMREVRRLIQELAASGKTVFVSTHLLSEAEQFCSHVAFMSQGRLVASGSREELRREFPAEVVLRVSPETAVLSRLGIRVVEADAAWARVAVPEDGLPSAVSELVAGGVSIYGFEGGQRSLEDIFVAEVGEGFDVR